MPTKEKVPVNVVESQGVRAITGYLSLVDKKIQAGKELKQCLQTLS